MNLMELFGVILGDGCLVYKAGKKKKVHFLGIAGNADDEQDYFAEIKRFLENLTSRHVSVRVRYHPQGKSLQLQLSSKSFLEFLMRKFKIHPPKTFNASIPRKYLGWKHSKHIIRGIFETDGSLFFSRLHRGGPRCYPRLEIKTSSPILAEQIVSILREQGFLARIINPRKDPTYRIYLSGYAMLHKWTREIGFSSQKNTTKVLFWKRFGYYIPKISLVERQRSLARGTPP
jgi:DNA-binding HxlR family transcriptional regulator